MKDALSEKYTSIFLTYLLAEGEVKKGDFREVIKSTTTIDKLVTKFEQEGFITVKKEFAGRRIHVISLTPKGRSVAEQLKRAEEAAKGVVIHEEEGRIEITNVPEEWRNKWKNLHALFHVNVFEDHVTIMETNHRGTGKPRTFNIYVKENGEKHLRLYCELDESFDCYHIGYALTLAAVQDMFARVRGGK